MSARYESWGRYPKAQQRVHRIDWRHLGLPSAAREEASILPFGNGRSYGDVCLNDDGALIDCAALNRLINFDSETGVIEAEAGVTLGDLLDFALPRGWCLPVSPGTRFATLAGAIANDVHGKNHHGAGTFGRHVLSFELMRSDGETMTCDAESRPELFGATIGGLGLTGTILSARVQLSASPTGWLDSESVRFANLDEYFALSQASDADYDYTVAWIDCLAKGEALGRGVFSRAKPAAHPGPQSKAKRPRQWGMPFTPPIALVNGLTLRAFNRWYFSRHSDTPQTERVPYAKFLYPLDSISHWNRIYGRKGFLQYQCVVPADSMRDAMKALLETIGQSGTGSFLAVLKVFGDKTSPGWLSFPMPGATLALDFPFHGASTLSLLERLDDITRAAGGRVYAAKDARMSAADFQAAYPRWEALAEIADPNHSSSFWRRVTETA